jgi:hypothetical protein
MVNYVRANSQNRQLAMIFIFCILAYYRYYVLLAEEEKVRNHWHYPVRRCDKLNWVGMCNNWEILEFIILYRFRRAPAPTMGRPESRNKLSTWPVDCEERKLQTVYGRVANQTHHQKVTRDEEEGPGMRTVWCYCGISGQMTTTPEYLVHNIADVLVFLAEEEVRRKRKYTKTSACRDTRVGRLMDGSLSTSV